MQTGSYTNVGGRNANEDSVRIMQRSGSVCAVVADGLGGHGGGAIASKAVVDTYSAQWKGEVDPQVLTDIAQQAHQAVQSHQTRDCAMKSTLVILAADQKKAAWAHVGDSRLYRFYNGKLEFQTRDHSASQLAVMMGDITPDQIRFHEDRSKILRAMGQEVALKVECGTADLQPGKYAFLLCSDGFWEYVLESEMEAELRLAASPDDWIARMRVYLAKRIPKDNDNNTAAVVWLTVT